MRLVAGKANTRQLTAAMLKSENPMDMDAPREDTNFKQEKETKEEQDSEVKQVLESTTSPNNACDSENEEKKRGVEVGRSQNSQPQRRKERKRDRTSEKETNKK